SAYSNDGRDFGVLLPETTTYGIPIREPSQSPEPKSACTGELSPIELISVAESLATGRLSTRAFHALDAGNTAQPPILGDVPVAAAAEAVTTSAARAIRRRTPAVSVPARTRAIAQMSLRRIAIATACVRFAAPSRSLAFRTWVRTVSVPIPSRTAISS